MKIYGGENMYILDVVIEHPLRHLDMTFSYLSDDDVMCGVRVHVPFGKQRLVGYVQATHPTDLSLEELCERDGITYKKIIDVIDEMPILTEELTKLATMLSKITFSPFISCLKTMLPPSLKPSTNAKMTNKVLKYAIYQNTPNKLTEKQSATLKIIQDKKEVPIKELNSATVKALEKKGAITIITKQINREVSTLSHVSSEIPLLNPYQNKALQALFSLDPKKPFLLHGVTGSGKTEVYLHAAKQMVSQHKQVLMLVPEISLTPKMVALFQNRFGKEVAILHSRLSDGQRYDEYRRILRQEVQIVVGARSAVFAPLDHIGLIILDEEHDQSYKQNNTPRYHTRDIALWRAKYHQAILLLGSASPSIESYAKAKAGMYHLLEMPYRATKQDLPKCQIVDMSKEAHSGNLSLFSKAFEDGLNRCLSQGKQALILVNRRGYATYLLCKDCGYVPKCPHCDVSLTYHKKDNVLRCHYCGYEQPYERYCQQCSSDMMQYKGMGTEQMEELLKQQFPLAKIIRYDMDTTRNKHGHEKLLDAFEKHEGNILLGTQMIAKGLDFKDVSFVGVLDGDSALNIPDFRSAERTFQLLLQVAGRSGRHQLGEVVIQTYNPSHYAIVCGARQDYLSFYKTELETRRLGFYPPYCYLGSILFSGKDELEIQKCASQFAKYIQSKLNDVQILGPAPAVISRINNEYRYRILIKYKQSNPLFTILSEALKNYKGKVKIDVDINPYTQL